jgi:predicted RNase H-like nuclease
MFGPVAPVWPFLTRFGLPQDPLRPQLKSQVIETFPALACVALGWTLDPEGALPKYNPRRPGFSIADWRFVCERARTELQPALPGIGDWLHGAGEKPDPDKTDQDCLDACICLIVAMRLVRQDAFMMVGNQHTGYMVVPFGEQLFAEVTLRCERTGRRPQEWVRVSPESRTDRAAADPGDFE